MADSGSALRPRQAGSSASRSRSLSSSARPSVSDVLLSGNVTDDDPIRELRDSVPDAPPRVQSVPGENPTNATYRRLGTPSNVSLKPKVRVSNGAPSNNLTYWPTILKWRAVIFLVLLYTATATAIGMLMWESIQDSNHNFRLSSENVHMISRYFPSIVGTITVLFFRQTVREALRMEPFVGMTDQNGEQNPGSEPWKGVGGAWFPWQSFTTTSTSFISFFSLLSQFVVSFIVSLKVALFASVEHVDNNTNQPYWILTVRLYPALLLIAGYIIMIAFTLYVPWHFRWKSTGLKWDPVSIADYASLFANCDALQYFAPLELRHDLRPKHVMVPDRRFRLGYWTRTRDNPRETDTVYGIGVGFAADADAGNTSRKERQPLGRPWQHIVTFRKPKPPPEPVDKCRKPKECAHGTWPNCEHYPYNYNPGCARWVIALASLLPISVLVLSIYALAIGLPYHGFSFSNDLKLPSDFHYGFGASNHTLPPIDPADPKSTVLLWALMFRSAPTYAAGLFTSTIITWIDLNMRFMQPFRNMFGEDSRKRTIWQRSRDWLGWWRPKPTSSSNNNALSQGERTPAKVEESILLAYITVSPLQVPLTAWDKGHIKVCIYSTLSTLSPLFPIFVGGLLTVIPNEKNDRVDFSFSLSAYIGIMVSLVLYSILLPAAMPGSDRLLPRQLYSLADLMAMCHESKFMATYGGTLLLTDDRFLFGEYHGRDGQVHIGFDVTKEREPDFGELKDVGVPVIHIPPEGFASRVQRTMTMTMEEGFASRVQRTMTMTMKEGLKVGRAMTGLARNTKVPFAQPDGIQNGEEYEIPLMSGGSGGLAEASGSQPEQVGNGGRTRLTRVDPQPSIYA